MTQIICPGCGIDVPEGISYCRECGTALTDIPAAAAPASPPPLPPAPAPPPPTGSGVTARQLMLATLLLAVILIAGFTYLGRQKDMEAREAMADALTAEAAPAAEEPQAAPQVDQQAAPKTEAAPVQAPPSTSQNAAGPLPANTQHDGWFVIVAGVGESAAEQPKLDAKLAAFQHCAGSRPQTGYSAEYRGMNPGYHIAMFGAFTDKRFAEEILQWARKCSPDAYLRRATRVPPM